MKPRNELPLSAYALYIRSQTLWGGALFMLPFVLLFMRGGGRGWLANTPADSLALTLAFCLLLCLPLAVVCAIAGFIVSGLQLWRNISGVILSVVITVATYAAALLLFTLFSTMDVKITWETIPLLSVITPCAAFSALILSACLPQAPPADEAQPMLQKSPPAANHTPATTAHTGQIHELSIKDYAFYISAQTLLGGTLITLMFVLFMANDDVFLPALLLYITFCVPFAVVCCCTGFLAGYLRLCRDAHGITRSIVITVVIYTATVLLFALFIEALPYIIPLSPLVLLSAAFSALILSIFLPKAPPAKVDE